MNCFQTLNKGGDSVNIPVNPIPVLKRQIEAHPDTVAYFIGFGEVDK